MRKVERILCVLISISIVIALVATFFNFTGKVKVEKFQQSGGVNIANSENIEKTINEVDWKAISDNELDRAICNTDEKEMIDFLESLSQEETELLLSKKTALIAPRKLGVPTGETHLDENGEEMPEIEFEITHDRYFDYLIEAKATDSLGFNEDGEDDNNRNISHDYNGDGVVDGKSDWVISDKTKKDWDKNRYAYGGFKVRIVKRDTTDGKNWNDEDNSQITMTFRFYKISRKGHDITSKLSSFTGNPKSANTESWSVVLTGYGTTNNLYNTNSTDKECSFDTDNDNKNDFTIKIEKVVVERLYFENGTDGYGNAEFGPAWEGPVVYLSYTKPKHYYPLWEIEQCKLKESGSLWENMNSGHRKIFTT